MNATQRNDFAKLMAELRNAGRELPVSLLDLHEWAVADQRKAYDRVLELERDIAALEQRSPEQGGKFELHLPVTVELTPAVRKKIRAWGGHYSSCLGHSSTRFVHIPNRDAEARELAASLMNEATKGKRRETVVMRSLCVDHVVYGMNWTAEDLFVWMIRLNRSSIDKLLVEKRKELENAKSYL